MFWSRMGEERMKKEEMNKVLDYFKSIEPTEAFVSSAMAIFVDVYKDPLLKSWWENSYLFKGYNAN